MSTREKAIDFLAKVYKDIIDDEDVYSAYLEEEKPMHSSKDLSSKDLPSKDLSF